METQDENREACNGYLLFRIGINEVATRFLSGDFEGGKEICNQAVDYIGSRDQLFHCYRGVGGGLGLFIESEYQPSDSLEGDDLYKLRTAVVKASHLCDQVPEDQIGECYQGLVGTRFRQMYLKLELFNERVEELINREDLKDFKVTG
jgi:hypothetical protein